MNELPTWQLYPLLNHFLRILREYGEWFVIEFLHLLHKPYWNRVTLSHNYIHQQSLHSLGLLAPNKYDVDLLNDVLNIDFSQGAAKFSEVKAGGWKKYLLTSSASVRIGLSQQFFFQPPTLTFDIFVAPCSKLKFSTLFERSFSNFLEPEV